jgi:oxygen-independent coproporphyrinogen-3 oxidase
MSSDGCSDPHTAGRRGSPNRRQRSSSSSWMQRTPAGLPWGMPGIGLLMDGAVQQAAQRERHSMR